MNIPWKAAGVAALAAAVVIVVNETLAKNGLPSLEALAPSFRSES